MRPKRLSQHCNAQPPLLSPSTGIIDSHGLMLAYQGDAENAGAQCVFQSPLLRARILGTEGFELSFGGQSP